MTMNNDDTPNLSRRALLRRIGLAAGAVYVAPVMLHIGAAQASTVSRASRPTTRRQQQSRPSRPTTRRQQSRPSRPARRQQQSRPSRPRRG